MSSTVTRFWQGVEVEGASGEGLGLVTSVVAPALIGDAEHRDDPPGRLLLDGLVVV